MILGVSDLQNMALEFCLRACIDEGKGGMYDIPRWLGRRLELH